MNDEKEYRTFREFYPFYLSEHANSTSRRLHFAGTSIALTLLIAAAVTQRWWLAGAALVQGYAFAWLDTFFLRTQQARDIQVSQLQPDGRLAPVVDILTGRQKF